MAYIKLLNEQLPEIVGLLDYRKETAKPLSELAEVLLRSDSSLTSGEREMIASYVSYKNDCHFCNTSHGAAAAAHLNRDLNLIDGATWAPQDREIYVKSEKQRAEEGNINFDLYK